MSEQPARPQTYLGNVFDQYQNMMQIARCVREAGRQNSRPQPRILELSRCPTNLNEYLPEGQIVRFPTHDEAESPALPLPVAIPFQDKCFDVCFVTDMYEHIPIGQRPGLLAEMLRVTHGLVLLGSPVKSAFADRLDRIIFDFIWGKYAQEFEPEKQHIRYGLQPVEEIVATLKAQGADRVAVLPDNFLYRFIHQILIFFDHQYQNPFSHFYNSVNRIYNERIAPYDYREPCYRYLMVVATDPALDLGLLEETMKGPGETPASIAAAEGALIEAFQQADSRSADQLRACMAEINRLRQENTSLKAGLYELGEDESEHVKEDNEKNLTALSRQLEEKELAIQILSATVANKQAQVEQVTSSVGWQVVNRYSWMKYYAWPLYRLFGVLLRHGGQAPNVDGAIEIPAQVFPPPMKYDVICFPIISWSFRFQRPQQLLTQFAHDGHRIFYLSDRFHQSSPDVVARPISENIYELQLPGPSHVKANIHKLSKPMLEKLLGALDEFRGRAGIAEAVSLVHLPFWGPLAFEARERWQWKLIYDCMDEHSGFSNVRRAALLPEKALIKRSDLVVATSKILYDKSISNGGRKVLLLPNAVDFDYFHQPSPYRLLDKISRPIVGYYGAISDWFNVRMIQEAAVSRPEWQFVLIGDTAGANVSSLKRLDNVYLMGEQPYITLSSYLNEFDVACIPFLITPLTQATNPVKFYEYLSAGKPVVAVELPELEPYREYFYPVRSIEEFVPQVEAALLERSPEKVQARIEFARRNTWLDRYKMLSASIKAM